MRRGRLDARPPGRGSTSSGVFLAISQYDFCTATQLLSADGFTDLADDDFQVFGNLMSATLNATVTVFDYVSMTSFDVYVDLVWTGAIVVGGAVPLVILAVALSAGVAAVWPLALAALLALGGATAWELVWVEAGQSVPLS